MKEYTRFKKTISDIDFKMLRKNDNCWIKVIPKTQKSVHSSIHIILNGEDHHWDIYDESGRNIHKIYFKGYKILPCFYLKSEEKSIRIDFNDDNIEIIPISKTHDMDNYIKENCQCNSQNAACWAIAIYSTSWGEKYPFNWM